MRFLIKIVLLVALSFSFPAHTFAEDGASKPKKKFLLRRKKKKTTQTKTRKTKKKYTKKRVTKKKTKKRVKKRTKKRVKKRAKKSKKRYSKKQRAAQLRAKRLAAKKAEKRRIQAEKAKAARLRAEAKAAKKRLLDPKEKHGEWQYLAGFGNGSVVAGINYQSFLSSGGFWRLETGLNTAVGDLGLGVSINDYSVNALVSANLTFFDTLTLSLKGGPAFRHTGLGIDATNTYYNYGGAISLNLGDRGSYGFSYYADMIGIAYIKKF